MVCESLCELKRLPTSILIMFPTFDTENQKISCRTTEVKAESEYSLYLVCSISRILKMSHSVVIHYCFALAMWSLKWVQDDGGEGGGGVAAHPLVKGGFQLRMEILRLRKNCLQEPFSHWTDM